MGNPSKAICQYCNRPTPDKDLVKWMCSLCRAYYGHVSDVKLRQSILKRLDKLLQEEINWLMDRIAQTQRQKDSRHWDLWLKDDREILAIKQRELMVVRQQLNQQVELTGQDIKYARLLRNQTQTQYARLSGISRMHLHRIEKGLVPINKKIFNKLKV